MSSSLSSASQLVIHSTPSSVSRVHCLTAESRSVSSSRASAGDSRSAVWVTGSKGALEGSCSNARPTLSHAADVAALTTRGVQRDAHSPAFGYDASRRRREVTQQDRTSTGKPRAGDPCFPGGKQTEFGEAARSVEDRRRSSPNQEGGN